MKIENTPARLLRTREAAVFLGIAESTLEKMRCLGGGPRFTKIGTRVVAYFPDDLLEWAGAKRRLSTSDSGTEAA